MFSDFRNLGCAKRRLIRSFLNSRVIEEKRALLGAVGIPKVQVHAVLFQIVKYRNNALCIFKRNISLTTWEAYHPKLTYAFPWPRHFMYMER
jgi:hypothetical protein